MSFTVEDEAAFQRRRDELGRDFAAWAEQHRVAADPGDAQLLLDWKWGYGDGELGRWSVPDVEEFLLEWCPRKLSCPPDLCAAIPLSVAAFLDFLAHRGLLAPGSQSPAALRRYCERVGPRFTREMADPANFGMAKSLLGGEALLGGGYGGGSGGGSGGAADTLLLERLRELTGEDPEQLLELLGAGTPPQPIGPVRLPAPAEHLAALRAAPTFRQVCGLAERCADPGLPVTTKGNLRLADTRRLVAELGTGDDVEPAHRTVQSATELPALAWVVGLAVAAGAVTRAQGRLVTRPGFAELSEPEAFRRMVGSAIELGLSLPGTGPRDADEGLLRTSAPILLAELLEAHAAGEPADVEDLVAATLELCEPAGDHPYPAGSRIVAQLERLLGLGIVRDAGAGAPGRPVADLEALELTAAGVTTAVDLVPEVLDIEVVARPDPATADASALAAVLPLLDRDEAEADLGAWFAARPDAGAAAGALLAEILAEARPAAEVLTELDLAGAVLGEHAETAAQAHRDGPHAPLVLTWMLSRGALDPADADPYQVMFGMVTVAATMMDVSGPEGALEFVQDADREQVLQLLEQLWRVDHPRLPDVLEAIGRSHPDKKIAKASRKCLMRHRSYAAR